MIRLYTLGTTRLSADDGHARGDVLSQPKALALLSYLAAAGSGVGTFHRRDNLLALFWPEHDEKHARWALNQTVHRLRSALGSSVIASRRTDALGVAPGALWCDAVAFRGACDQEDYDGAMQLYRGEFLHGLHVAGCVELGHWLDAQRAELRQLASRASWGIVDRLRAGGEMRAALEHARKAVRLAPEDEPGVRRLITLLDVLGDRAGAAQVYDDYVSWLGEHLGVTPALETVAMMEGIRARPTTSVVTKPSTAKELGTPLGGGLPKGDDNRPNRAASRRRLRRGITGAAMGAIVLLTMRYLWAPDGAREQRTSTTARSVDPEAHQAYLKGLYHLGKGTRRSYQTATQFFRQAIDRDPTYAPAYVGLADGYNRSAIQGNQPARTLYPLANAALRSALKLDETLADAYALRGVLKFRYYWDWEGAERDFRRAIELEPNNVRARLAYGTYHLAAGRLDQALSHVAEFQELDPLSSFASGNLGWHFYYNRRYEDAVRRLRMALDLDPAFGPALALLGQVYAANGAHSQAIAACDTALGLTPDEDEVLNLCGAAYAFSGERAAAIGLLEKLRMRASTRGYVDPYRLASVSAAIHASPAGIDSVFHWLAQAYDERSPQLCFLRVDPVFRRVRTDARFQELVQRMAFPN